MRQYLAGRRYLVSFDSEHLPHVFCDVLVIGSGVAGLRAALAAAQYGKVILVAKGALDECNTRLAQGGIAAALDPRDSVEKHTVDTVAVGQGLCDEAAVRSILTDGPQRVRELVEFGAEFDLRNGALDLAQEGGHGMPRIAHAHGDSTGAEIERILLLMVKRHPNIQRVDHGYALDLITDDGGCRGMFVSDKRWGMMFVWAKQTILATGGAGQLYRETTGAEVTTGDGIALAYRAGCELRDLEFMQFHPTTLYLAGASRILITETARGEGAILRNKDGEAFMKNYHPQAELAPRDVVSRSIIREMQRTKATHVYLDFRHMGKEKVLERFPRLRELCKNFELDLATDMIPVRPSAHYTVGGVTVDVEGRTNVPNLYACGEVASTGLHGANRLGSNSLLEGLVCGCRAGANAGAAAKSIQFTPARVHFESGLDHGDKINVADVSNSLRSLMWRNVGIERNATLLEEAERMIDLWCGYVLDKEFRTLKGWELQNMLTTAKLMTVGALRRTETRGVHYRVDFPNRDDEHWQRHIAHRRDNA